MAVIIYGIVPEKIFEYDLCTFATIISESLFNRLMNETI